MVVSRGNGNSVNSMAGSRSDFLRAQWRRPSPLTKVACVQDEITKIKAARVEMQRLCLSAQRQLERAKQLRAAAEQYQEEVEARAQSNALQIVHQARLEAQEEIEEFKRETTGKINELLANFQVLRSAALTVLEAQRKFADAARIKSIPSAYLSSGGE